MMQSLSLLFLLPLPSSLPLLLPSLSLSLLSDCHRSYCLIVILSVAVFVKSCSSESAQGCWQMEEHIPASWVVDTPLPWLFSLLEQQWQCPCHMLFKSVPPSPLLLRTPVTIESLHCWTLFWSFNATTTEVVWPNRQTLQNDVQMLPRNHCSLTDPYCTIELHPQSPRWWEGYHICQP